MTEKPTIEMLYQALKDFKDNFDKFQSEYGKGVDRHRMNTSRLIKFLMVMVRSEYVKKHEIIRNGLTG